MRRRHRKFFDTGARDATLTLLIFGLCFIRTLAKLIVALLSPPSARPPYVTQPYTHRPFHTMASPAWPFGTPRGTAKMYEIVHRPQEHSQASLLSACTSPRNNKSSMSPRLPPMPGDKPAWGLLTHNPDGGYDPILMPTLMPFEKRLPPMRPLVPGGTWERPQPRPPTKWSSAIYSPRAQASMKRLTLEPMRRDVFNMARPLPALEVLSSGLSSSMSSISPDN